MNKRKKSVFGEYLVTEIKAAGMSQEEFYTAVGIAKPYFYDILTASPPPIDLQNRMLHVLNAKTGEDSERTSMFYDLAAKERKEIPADIRKLIIDNPQKMREIRSELIALLSTQ